MVAAYYIDGGSAMFNGVAKVSQLKVFFGVCLLDDKQSMVSMMKHLREMRKSYDIF